MDAALINEAIVTSIQDSAIPRVDLQKLTDRAPVGFVRSPSAVASAALNSTQRCQRFDLCISTVANAVSFDKRPRWFVRIEKVGSSILPSSTIEAVLKPETEAMPVSVGSGLSEGDSLGESRFVFVGDGL